jgi:hypothetical protein
LIPRLILAINKKPDNPSVSCNPGMDSKGFTWFYNKNYINNSMIR